MSGLDCVQFLQWALPYLHLRWPGFRKVRGQVCKRVQRRMRELELSGYLAYRDYLQTHPDEWTELDQRCRITISRFYRDKATFEFLGRTVIPALARAALQDQRTALKIWSVGCGAGEEPYSIALLWDQRLQNEYRALTLDILATDTDSNSLTRAARGCYSSSSLRDLPRDWIESEFEPTDGTYCLRAAHRRNIHFVEHDVRTPALAKPFDLILCRNLAFTYFDEPLQVRTLRHLVDCLLAGGALVIGGHERLPETLADLRPWSEIFKVYRKRHV